MATVPLAIPLASRATPLGAGGAPLPFSVFFENNQAINREFIDLLGYQPSVQVTSRNGWERLERFAQMICWLTLGNAAPLALFEWGISRPLTRRFRAEQPQYYQAAGLAHPPSSPAETPIVGNWPRRQITRLANWLGRLGQGSPLQIPFESLDTSGFFQNAFATQPDQRERLVQALGLRDTVALEKLLASHGNRLLRWKLGLVFTSLTLVAAAGQSEQWVKNWLTERFSGKKGFSGEFTYASEEYRKTKAADYEASKRKNLIRSLAIGIAAGILPVPAILWLALKSKGQTALSRGLKRLVPPLNYGTGIFVNKWLLGWASIFNWLLPGIFAARDNHERREVTTRVLSTMFFFMIGDEIASGLGAAVMQRRLDAGGNPEGVRIVKKGVLGLPAAEKLQVIYDRVGPGHRAFRLAKRNYWFGLLAAAAGMGIVTPLLNNYYTKKKVVTEQAAMAAKRFQVLGTKPLAVKKPFQQFGRFDPVAPLLSVGPFPRHTHP